MASKGVQFEVEGGTYSLLLWITMNVTKEIGGGAWLPALMDVWDCLAAPGPRSHHRRASSILFRCGNVAVFFQTAPANRAVHF